MDAPTILIIDVGSMTTKLATCHSTSSTPSPVITEFPSTVGSPKNQFAGMIKDTNVGEEAMANRSMLRLRWPVDYGVVTNWDGLEQIFHHAFYSKARVRPENTPVLVVEKCVRQPKSH